MRRATVVRFASVALTALAALLVAPAPARATASSTASAAELVRQAHEHETAHEDLLAIRRYTEALALDPTSGDAYLGLGALRFRRGDVRESERVFDVALAHLPSLTAALLGRGKARWSLGFNDQAEEDFREYERTSEDPRALKDLADFYAKQSRAPAQLATWRRIRALAAAKGDVALEREARTFVRALQSVLGTADPVGSPPVPSNDPVRRGIAHLARRGG